ncbi:MAG TPA: DUF885 domain-containing protein, partial [Nannocystaceae bacterium]|nr:DUF885 domain-containing protein [Nannocystaceae bacterium]
MSARSPRMLLAVLLALAACKPEPTTKPPVVTPPMKVDFAAEIDRIFAAWLAAAPVTATSLGEHSHDGAWPDLSAEGITADRKRIDDGLAKVQDLAGAQLTADERIDLDVVRAELELQKFVHEVEQPWKRDPSWYTSTIGSGLEDLVSREFAPLEQRGAAVASRIEGLPKLVEQARTNIVAAEAYEPQTRVAIGQIEGIAVLLEQIIPDRLAPAPQDLRDRVAAASKPALAAIRALQTELDQQVLPNAKGQWRLGAQNFEKKLALTLQSNITATELRRVAVVEHGRVRKKMSELAYDLGLVLFTPRQIARMKARAPGDPDTEVIRAVLEELASAHVEPDELRETIDELLGRLTGFVKDHGIVTMDDAEVLQVIWTPPHQRGVFIAGLAAPGPLEPQATGLPSFYLVQPVPTDWSSEVRESFLREYNDFMLEILSIHEAIPGHFVQLYYAKREPSKVRKVLANGAFVEGWAVYAEKVMVDAGYAGMGPGDEAKRPRGVGKGTWKVMQDPTLRAKAIALHGLKFYLRSVTNAILDHGVHAGEMSEEEAIQLMVERSFQQEGEARGKWVRAQVTSTQLSTYFVGAQAWLRLRAHAEARARDAGTQFDLAAFHDAALSHGAPPVHRLPILMGWD